MSLTLEETARRLAHYERVESWLFRTMGEWAGSVLEVEAKVALAAHAREHAWHADLWRERLPTPPVPVGADGTPPDPLAAFAPAIQQRDGPAGERTLERLVAIYRVLLPRSIVTYWRHLSEASPVSDGPVTRALKLVLHDETEEWRRGEALVQGLLASPDDAARAASEQARLESILVHSWARDGRPLPL